jgi:flagellar basal body rod protein FlgC
MKLQKALQIVSMSLIVSSILVGCGSSSSSSDATSTTVSGVAIDPELQGANVFVDANENGIYDNGELNTTTDNLGNYSLDIKDSDIGKPIVVTGGVDRVTKKRFTGKLTAIIEAGKTQQHITPLTTLIEKYKNENNITSIDDVKAHVAAQLGLNVDDLDKNIVEAGNETALKVALRVENVAKNIANETADKGVEDIYKIIAAKLKESNVSKALEDCINQEINSTSLTYAKINDLDKELDALDESGLSAEALALTVDNIDTNITNAQSEQELNDDLYLNSNIIVENTTEVEEEKARRTFDSLGLGDLNDTIKEQILSNINFDLDQDSLDEIKSKIAEEYPETTSTDDNTSSI